MNLVLLLLTAFFQTEAKPPLTMDSDQALAMVLPGRVLEQSDFRKRLYSGLTTSIELVTRVRAGKETKESFCLLEIRYEIWEEQLLVRLYEADRTVSRMSFGSLGELTEWLHDNPLRIAMIGQHGGSPLNVKVQCRIIPFSQAEESQTRAWFSNVVSVPDAAQRGQQDRDRARDVDQAEADSGIFDLLMTTSIKRRSVMTFKWKWRLMPEG